MHKEPDIRIENAALDAWKNVQLANAEGLLTAAISTSKNTAHILASRALVRARLQQLDAALVDAEKVHAAQLSFISTLTPFYQVHRNSVICHWLHCEICGSCQKAGHRRRLSGVRHCGRALSKLCLPFPSHQGAFLRSATRCSFNLCSY